MRMVLEGKYAADAKTYRFDFSSYLGPGESLVSSAQTYVLYSGDASGPAPSFSSPSVAANTAVFIVSGGAVGNVYSLIVTGTTSAGQTVALNAFLPILPGQP